MDLLDLTLFKRVHFTGIKGVGMAALAYVAMDYGMAVTGSDIEEWFVTDDILTKKGISWRVGFSEKNIQVNQPDLVIYTAAHKGEDNCEVVEAKKLGIPVLSQGQALGLFQRTKTGISVAGVGGKTTTSAMLATIFEYAAKQPSYMIGAGDIPSLAFPGKYNDKGAEFIAEADEYASSPTDRRPKFFYQNPLIIILTNLAFDHPDIYKDERETLATFKEFIQKLPPNGLLVANSDSLLFKKLQHELIVPTITFGDNDQADWRITNYSIQDEKAEITVKHNNETFRFYLKIPGKHNARNALAAIIVARRMGLGMEIIQEGLYHYLGAKRRLEKICEVNSTVLYDDYAHHPNEIKATLETAKTWFKGKYIIAIFQPHTYSRTKALFQEFCKCFTDADEVILPDIYASARENEDPSISSKLLAEAVVKYHPNTRYLSNKEAVLSYLKGRDLHNTVILTMGAGDVFSWNGDITQLIKENYA